MKFLSSLLFATAGLTLAAEDAKNLRPAEERDLLFGGGGYYGGGFGFGAFCNAFCGTSTTKFVADLGPYGVVKLKAFCGGNFEVDVRLENLDDVNTGAVSDLAYHLHSGYVAGVGGAGFAARSDSDPAGNKAECGGGFTAGHYDPTRACGPASTIPACPGGALCCDPKGGPDYCPAGGDGSACEVGDLSGLFGRIPIDAHGNARREDEYEGDYDDIADDFLGASTLAFDTWGSIVFHGEGGDRVLCGNFVKYY